ncbi:MAG: hypothetical protein GQ540_03490 [Lutibacter sp.]|uniref:hypothetical protein n=1 Tax=Lutibacter sp. TaxID=1925666 RepID=UPI001A0F5F20|nr:hypothetical protein [Lutibacter sp.]NOR27576.1 hypothetical protein [Lutibacter sp.]
MKKKNEYFNVEQREERNLARKMKKKKRIKQLNRDIDDDFNDIAHKYNIKW